MSHPGIPRKTNTAKSAGFSRRMQPWLKSPRAGEKFLFGTVVHVDVEAIGENEFHEAEGIFGAGILADEKLAGAQLCEDFWADGT
jgi:hypothetical protein